MAKRIDRAFRKTYSHSRACLSFQTAPLEWNKELAVEGAMKAVVAALWVMLVERKKTKARACFLCFFQMRLAGYGRRIRRCWP